MKKATRGRGRIVGGQSEDRGKRQSREDRQTRKGKKQKCESKRKRWKKTPIKNEGNIQRMGDDPAFEIKVQQG